MKVAVSVFLKKAEPMHSTGIRLLVMAFAGLVSAAAAKDPTTNILFIFTDDESFRTVSCYPGAYHYANTPQIDRLAETGIRFDQAYIGAKCVPSRASTLTGRFQYACAEGQAYKSGGPLHCGPRDTSPE